MPSGASGGSVTLKCRAVSLPCPFMPPLPFFFAFGFGLDHFRLVEQLDAAPGKLKCRASALANCWPVTFNSSVVPALPPMGKTCVTRGGGVFCASRDRCDEQECEQRRAGNRAAACGETLAEHPVIPLDNQARGCVRAPLQA